MAKKKIKRKKTKKKTFKLKKNVRLKSLNPAYQPRVRKELIDFDYIDQLNDDDKKWLAQFVDESIGANIRKTKNGKIRAGHIHNTLELAKECYDANNKRNNDVLSVTKANGLLSDIQQATDKNDGWYITNSNLTEEAILAKIDNNNEEDMILTLDEYKKLKKNLTKEMIDFYDKYYKLK